MILVSGATGTVGRQVVAQLVAADRPVRAIARDPDGAALPDNVEIVSGELSQPATLAPHLDGVDAVFLLWPCPTVESVGGLGPELIAADPPGGFWRAVEKLLETSGLQWRFVRPTGFAKNTLIWARQIRAGNVVRWPYPDAARSTCGPAS